MLTKFWKSEDGAVTVDWVVMTAALCGIGVATTAAVQTGVVDLTSDTSTTMSGFEISTSFGSGYTIGDWTALNPGAVANNQAWMEGFADDQLLAHMNNMEQYADVEQGAGHPYETYHDEYWIAKDEAASRGLL